MHENSSLTPIACIYSLSRLNPLTIINIVTNSAAGKASHTPVMPKAAESANAKMLIAIKPRMIDAANAYFTDSTALRISRTYYIDSGKNKACKVKAQSALGHTKQAWHRARC